MIRKYFMMALMLPFLDASQSVFAENCDGCISRQEAAKTCRVTVGTKEVEESCYDVECEDICIPPVRFWWECGPLDRCGRVRTVRKLVTEKSTKDVCTYDWSVVTICESCFADVHRLRCRTLGVSEATAPEAVGLPNPPAEDRPVRVALIPVSSENDGMISAVENLSDRTPNSIAAYFRPRPERNVDLPPVSVR